MNTLWVGAFYYFLNVILHTGIFGVLFFVSIPDNFTWLEYISEFWHSSEGREIILINSSLLMANLVFALSIIFIAPRSTLLLIIMTFIAWIGLLVAYFYGSVGLLAYAAGAIQLSFISFTKFKVNTHV
jgi:hypothetical protein